MKKIFTIFLKAHLFPASRKLFKLIFVMIFLFLVHWWVYNLFGSLLPLPISAGIAIFLLFFPPIREFGIEIYKKKRDDFPNMRLWPLIRIWASDLFDQLIPSKLLTILYAVFLIMVFLVSPVRIRATEEPGGVVYSANVDLDKIETDQLETYSTREFVNKNMDVRLQVWFALFKRHYLKVGRYPARCFDLSPFFINEIKVPNDVQSAVLLLCPDPNIISLLEDDLSSYLIIQRIGSQGIDSIKMGRHSVMIGGYTENLSKFESTLRKILEERYPQPAIDPAVNVCKSFLTYRIQSPCDNPPLSHGDKLRIQIAIRTEIISDTTVLVEQRKPLQEVILFLK